MLFGQTAVLAAEPRSDAPHLERGRLERQVVETRRLEKGGANECDMAFARSGPVRAHQSPGGNSWQG